MVSIQDYNYVPRLISESIKQTWYAHQLKLSQTIATYSTCGVNGGGGGGGGGIGVLKSANPLKIYEKSADP